MSSMRDADTNATSLPDPSLDALALAEALAAMRAAGDTPRLSALIAAWQDAAGALAEATLLASAEDELLATSDAEPGDAPVPLSLGTQRALGAIFGAGGGALPVADATSGAKDERGALVAEAPAPYIATAPASVGLLELAQKQGLDDEALAARIMLSAEVVRWLDRVALPVERQPDALVAHLVGALGAPHAQISAALANGEVADEPPDARDMLLSTSASLTPAQRAYWATLLASSG